jgi:hypothetical protein
LRALKFCHGLTAKFNDELFDQVRATSRKIFMRILRALFVPLVTAFVGCVLAFFVGDYLTRFAYVPEMEGQRAMTIFFLCVPPGIIAALVRSRRNLLN